MLPVSTDMAADPAGSAPADGQETPLARSNTTATVQLSVMTDGTIGVAGEVDGYMRDSNDNWITS